jgi:hypothetical protein
MIKLFKCDPTQKKEYEEKIFKMKNESYIDNKGFTLIWEAMKESKIPLIGHNCLFDILFMFSHFNNYIKPDYEYYFSLKF